MGRGTDIMIWNAQRSVRVDIAELTELAEGALCECLKLRRRKTSALTNLKEISVLLVSDRRMSQLHRQFLQAAGPTDILTFEHGEILISAPTAKRNARRFGNSLRRELCLYIIHGLLHLHGFDDQTERDAREMERTQNRILERLHQDDSPKS
jgi:probable rRNA maturation factor